MNRGTGGHALLAPVLDYVTSHAGLRFSDSRIDDAEFRVARAMRRVGVDDPAGFVARLGSDPLVRESLVAELTIGETYFNREPAMFEYLRTVFFPRVVRERGPGYVVRVWSAGCSSGEEAYSLAMLLEESGLGDRSMVLGTDVAPDALDKARHGSYGSWSFRGTDEAFLLKYFTGEDGRFTLQEPIRSRVRFERHNLAEELSPAPAPGTGGFDLILCRNVLMYFDARAVERVALALYASLGDAGWLVTGASDPALDQLAPFQQVPSDAGIVYQRGGRGALQPHPDAAVEHRRHPQAAAAPRPWRAPPPDPAAAAGPVVGDSGHRGPGVRARPARRPDHRISDRTGADAAASLAGYPGSAERPFLEAVGLAGAGRYAEAVAAVHSALYLDRSQPAFHFVLGASLWNLGDLAGARRGFRNAHELAAAMPATQIVPFTEGETAGRVARGAAAQLAMISAGPGAPT